MLQSCVSTQGSLPWPFCLQCAQWECWSNVATKYPQAPLFLPGDAMICTLYYYTKIFTQKVFKQKYFIKFL